MLQKGFHLTFCTNIYPGESWEETFTNLKNQIPGIKKDVSPESSFGIGLRLSDKASITLLEGNNIAEFRTWLKKNNCYVFTLNGFPYGEFHNEKVKDQVHFPDWTSEDRLNYSSRLFDILAEVLPPGLEGGISTSPLSYKYWADVQKDEKVIFKMATRNIIRIAEKLFKVQKETGRILHLDIEPEPDGLLETSEEVILWFKEWLIPQGSIYLMEKFDLSNIEAESCIKTHIRICYDICHFAIGYEKAEDVFSLFRKQGIRIGKIQISAALQCELYQEQQQREQVRQALIPFIESTYLHQVVEQDSGGNLFHYRDLPMALENITKSSGQEWRIHFHVPVFLSQFEYLRSTQKEILEVFEILKNEKITDHLEVETYTWEVLPPNIQLGLQDSIVRELQWVRKKL